MAAHDNQTPVPGRAEEELRRRLQQVQEQIARAAREAGRSPEEITLIGVSKRFPAETAAMAVRCGLKDLGENRVQEMLPKMDDLSGQQLSPRWHLIGTLQKNKVKYIIGRCHLIHSVDSTGLLQQIDRRSRQNQISTDILLQVNSSGEESKHGFSPLELLEAARMAFELPGIRLCGLMTMAPLTDDPEITRPFFERTRELFHKIAAASPQQQAFKILSMGMSQDFIQAIACGATHVRIGTAIFGLRDPDGQAAAARP